jgi:Bacterial antitoxin of type II TA system, VapB
MLCHNLQLDDELVKQAFRLAPVTSLSELVNFALQKLITTPPPRPLKVTEATGNPTLATNYRIQPVTLGAKLVNLDNIAEVLAIAEGEAYR